MEKYTPRTGFIEIFIVLILVFILEIIGIFLPFVGSTLLAIICEIYVFLRRLPPVAPLVGWVASFFTDDFAFGLTIGMGVVFWADHHPKAAAVATKAAQMTGRGKLAGATNAAGRAQSISQSTKTPTSANTGARSQASGGSATPRRERFNTNNNTQAPRKERWYTERGSAIQTVAEKPGEETGIIQKNKTRKDLSREKTRRQENRSVSKKGSVLVEDIFKYTPEEIQEKTMEKLPGLEDVDASQGKR